MGHVVFVSYRWGKSCQSDTLRLAEELRHRIPRINIYVDIKAREVNDNIRERIQSEIRSTQIMIVVIHPDWIESIPRLHDPNDLVRLEIEVALAHGIKVLPIYIEGASELNANDLPESIKSIAELQAFKISKGEDYELDLDLVVSYLRRSLPTIPQRLFDKFASNSAANMSFGAIILAGLMLFLSRMLNIHTFYFPIEIDWQVGSRGGATTVQREGGLLLSLNWVIVLVLITPIMIVLFSQLLRRSRSFIEEIHVKQMVLYVGQGGVTTPTTYRRLWDQIAIPSSKWLVAFFTIAIVLGIVQWWQYSGQWYWGEYIEKNFLGVSTGPDWHVSWALGVENLQNSGLTITLFTLGMYLVYGISSAITFSFYAFLFNLVSQLASLATVAGVGSEKVLRLDIKDSDTGGLSAFETIQHYHASFCYWSIVAMYFMSLRNAFLPPLCKLPESMYSAEEAPYNHCTTMLDFISVIGNSIWHFLQTLFSGNPDFSILFFNYSNYNLFILGSMLHVILVASFFFLISARMLFIIESARLDTRGLTSRHHVGDQLVRSIRRENVSVLFVMLGGALSIVFLNLGPLMLFFAIIFTAFSGTRRKNRLNTP